MANGRLSFELGDFAAFGEFVHELVGTRDQTLEASDGK